MLNLDTHILLFSLTGQLTSKEERFLKNNSWSCSAIVFWEIAKLIQLGRVSTDIHDAALRRTLNRMYTWPLTWEISKATCELDFDSDPADEIIAATSIVHQIPLLTRDKKILRSKTVPLAR